MADDIIIGYIEEIEDAADDEDRLFALYERIGAAATLVERDRQFLLGRVQRYLYDFQKMREAAASAAAEEEIMSGVVNPNIEEPTSGLGWPE